MLKGSESGEKSFSKPIVSIALAGIALGMAVMILSMAIVTGFKAEVRNKVTGFGAHIQITGLTMNNSYESEAMERKPALPGQIAEMPTVKSVSVFATKPGIVETETDIHGVITKGIGADFDWSFFSDTIVAGALPQYSDTVMSNQVLVSAELARILKLEVEDRITIYFSNPATGSMSPRRFEISGLYATGLEEFDSKFVFLHIGHLQRINKWGLDAQMRVTGNCEKELIYLEGLAFGGDGDYRYRWSVDGMHGPGPHAICINRDSTVKVVVSDHSGTIRDSAMFAVNYPDSLPNCLCDTDAASVTTSGGSGKQYIGGYEVMLHDFRDLQSTDLALYEQLEYDLKTTTIAERIPEIFNWLEMIDINPKIIIALMILVAVINMSSALLILILERVNMIGILKALGASDWSVRKIFLRTAGFLISRGLIIGNALGIGLCLLQNYFKIVKLDPVNYFVSEVPVMLKWEHILALNAVTLIICLLVLIVPSMLITRISPVKAIRFD